MTVLFMGTYRPILLDASSHRERPLRSSRRLDKVGVKASCAEVLPRHTSPRKLADNDILPLLLHGGLQHLRKESLPSPLPILITQPRAVDDRTIGYDRIPFVTASRRVANE
jgi:hypothetical protein